MRILRGGGLLTFGGVLAVLGIILRWDLIDWLIDLTGLILIVLGIILIIGGLLQKFKNSG